MLVCKRLPVILLPVIQSCICTNISMQHRLLPPFLITVLFLSFLPLDLVPPQTCLCRHDGSRRSPTSHQHQFLLPYWCPAIQSIHPPPPSSLALTVISDRMFGGCACAKIHTEVINKLYSGSPEIFTNSRNPPFKTRCTPLSILQPGKEKSYGGVPRSLYGVRTIVY